jgi:hypothetical protein
MGELSARVVEEQVALIGAAASDKVREDPLDPEDLSGLLDRMRQLGLLSSGSVRASWLLHNKKYRPLTGDDASLLADLLLALATMSRISRATASIVEDGIVDFIRDGRVVASFMVASGRGSRSRAAVEADAGRRRARYRARNAKPDIVLIAGTSDGAGARASPPSDVIRGEPSGDVLRGGDVLQALHVSELRTKNYLIQEVVP